MPNLDPARRHLSTMAAYILLALAAVAVARSPTPVHNQKTDATSCEIRLECPKNEPITSVHCRFPQDITLPPSKLGFTLYQTPFRSNQTSKVVVLSCHWVDGIIPMCIPKSSPYRLTTPSAEITDNVTFQVPIDSAVCNEFSCGMIEKGSDTRPQLPCHLDVTLLSNVTDVCRSETQVRPEGTTEHKEVFLIPLIVVLILIVYIGLGILICKRRRVIERFCKRPMSRGNDNQPDSASNEDITHVIEEDGLDDLTKSNGWSFESKDMDAHLQATPSSQSSSLISNNPTPSPSREVHKPRGRHVRTPTKYAYTVTIAQACLVAVMVSSVSAVETTTTAIQHKATVSCKVDMDIKQAVFVTCIFPIDVNTHQWDFTLQYLHTTAHKTIVKELAAMCHWPPPLSYNVEPGFKLIADQIITNTAKFTIPNSTVCYQFFCQLSPEDIDIRSVPCQLPNIHRIAFCKEPLGLPEELHNSTTKGQLILGTGFVISITLSLLCGVLTTGCSVICCKYRLVSRKRKNSTDSENPDSSRLLNSCVYKTRAGRPMTNEADEEVSLQSEDEEPGLTQGQGLLPPGYEEIGLIQGECPEIEDPPPEPAVNHDRFPAPVREDNPSPNAAPDIYRQPEQDVVTLSALSSPAVSPNADSKTDQSPGHGGSDEGQPAVTRNPSEANREQSSDKCDICWNNITNPKSLSCGHTFCTACIDKWLKQNPTCPRCYNTERTLLGDQPEDGTMAMTYSKEPLLGYDSVGSFVIKYHFHAGSQQDHHPTPGKHYDATQRLAYLPDTEEGRKVLMLLRIAFDRRLTFTIGQSLNSGSQVEGIIWNIHHKTFRKGGQAQYGYPDKGYLARVQEDLRKKGVTEADLTQTQRDFIDDPHSVCPTYDEATISPKMSRANGHGTSGPTLRIDTPETWFLKEESMEADLREDDSDMWTVEQVGQWMDKNGLGGFKRTFRKSGVDGKRLHVIIHTLDKLVSRATLDKDERTPPVVDETENLREAVEQKEVSNNEMKDCESHEKIADP